MNPYDALYIKSPTRTWKNLTLVNCKANSMAPAAAGPLQPVGSTLISRPNVPDTAGEAPLRFKDETVLMPPSVRARNSRWKLFTNWLQRPSASSKYKYSITPLGLIVFFVGCGMDLDDSDGLWQDCHDPAKKVPDYVSTIKQRLTSAGEFSGASMAEAQLAENRLKGLSLKCAPAKVLPAWNGPTRKLSARAIRLARLWFYAGFRISSFEALGPHHFQPMREGRCDGLFQRISCYKPKYTPELNAIETRCVPAHISAEAACDFPVSRTFINNYILTPAGLSSNSFRRGLATTLRIELNMGGEQHGALRLFRGL